MKKRVGIWWEKISPKLWEYALIVLLFLLVVLFAVFLIVIIWDDPQWIYPRLGIETKTWKKIRGAEIAWPRPGRPFARSASPDVLQARESAGGQR